MTEVLDLRITPADDNTTSPAAGVFAGPCTDWVLGDAILVRVAGQPVGRTRALRCPQTRAWVDELIELEARVAQLAGQLRDVLTESVARCAPESPERGPLINLRRDAFNGRRPRTATLERVIKALDFPTRAIVLAWVDALDRAEAWSAQGQALLSEELSEARGGARRAISDPDLRSAVLLQSEVLERQMDRYLDPARKLDKHGRQIERTLLEILYRATMKTSPFSTLTSVAMVELAAGGAGLHPVDLELDHRSFVRLNVAVLARLSSVIAARTDLPRLMVSLAPGVSAGEDLVRYARRRSSAVADPDAVVAIDGVHESLFFLPSGPALADVITVLGGGSRSLQELKERVQFARPDEEREPEQVDALIGHLIRLGLLVLPDLQIDLRAADPIVPFVAGLRRTGEARLVAVANGLDEVRDLVSAYPRTEARGRRAVIDQVRTLLARVFQRLGAPTDLVPRTVLYEDALVPPRARALDRSRWEEAYLPHLSALAKILPAFDVNLPRRLTALGFFKARYGVGGTCDDLEQFCHEFQRDFYDPYSQRLMRRRAFDETNSFIRQENWFNIPQIAAVDSARSLASSMLDEAVRAQEPSSVEVRLDETYVGAIREALGEHSSYQVPWSFFVQTSAAPGSDRPGRLVLNQAYAGLTLMFSRFGHGFDTLSADPTSVLRRSIRRIAPDDAVVAEIRGGFESTNLNIHPVVTDFELVCPGDVSERPAQEQITLDELVVRHDPAVDQLRLWCPRLGRHVIPVYLGFLMPMALPEIQQVLLCMSPMGMAQIDLWAGTGDPVPDDAVSEYPRISLDSFVLQRRMWKIPVHLFPVRDPQTSDASWFAAVQRWRHSHGMPDRVFAQVDFAAAASGKADDGDEGEDATGQRKASRKPLSVDFESWMSVQLLTQLASSATSRLVVREALPDVNELWLGTGQQSRVTEFLVEVYPKEPS